MSSVSIGKVCWVLMRGLGRESGHWSGFLEKMREAFIGDHVLALDHPGTGQNRDQKVPLSIKKMVDRAREQVVDAQYPLIVLGHSLGGMVALDWWSRFPSEVKGFVGINTSTSSTGKPWERMTLTGLSRVIEIAMDPTEKGREEKVLSLVSRRPELNKGVLADWVRIAKERGPEKTLVVKQLLAAVKFRTPLRPSEQSAALLLGSYGDELVNPICIQRLANELKAELRMHSWGGHELTLDDPDWVIDQLKGWKNQLKI